MSMALLKNLSVKECPFCRNVEKVVVVFDELHMNADAKDYFVSCDFCGACGPSAKTPKEAVKKWNRAPRYV